MAHPAESAEGNIHPPLLQARLSSQAAPANAAVGAGRPGPSPTQQPGASATAAPAGAAGGAAAAYQQQVMGQVRQLLDCAESIGGEVSSFCEHRRCMPAGRRAACALCRLKKRTEVHRQPLRPAALPAQVLNATRRLAAAFEKEGTVVQAFERCQVCAWV